MRISGGVNSGVPAVVMWLHPACVVQYHPENGVQHCALQHTLKYAMCTALAGKQHSAWPVACCMRSNTGLTAQRKEQALAAARAAPKACQLVAALLQDPVLAERSVHAACMQALHVHMAHQHWPGMRYHGRAPACKVWVEPSAYNARGHACALLSTRHPCLTKSQA